MNDLQIFVYSGEQLRTIQRDDGLWWVLRDVCQVLGLTTPARVAERLDEELEHIDLCFVYSTQARIAVRIDNGQYTIIWDECYWKYYRKYLMAVGTARKNKMSVTQAVT